MLYKKLKKEQGITAVDTMIAIMIMALFVGLLASVSYNIYLTNSAIKRNSQAIEYIVDVFEYIEKSDYDKVTEKNLIDYFNDKYSADNNSKVKARGSQEERINKPFEVIISVINYNSTEGNTDKLDVVKEINIKVNYTLGNKEQQIEMKRLKQK